MVPRLFPIAEGPPGQMMQNITFIRLFSFGSLQQLIFFQLVYQQLAENIILHLRFYMIWHFSSIYIQ